MLRQTLQRVTATMAVGALAVVGLLVLTQPDAQAAQAMPLARPEIVSKPAASASLNFTIALSQVESGLTEPVFLTHAGDGSGRLFVVERAGYIRIIKNGSLLATPYLDIDTLVGSGESEQGLLSVAFDRDYKTNGVFYVNYTNNSGDTVVARYRVANPAADVAATVAVTPIISIDQPQANHNGGQLQFGPNDNYLYIGMGDGGGSGDDDSGHAPGGNGQSPGTLLGKILRIHVRGVPTYTIPASNPFTRTAGYKPEIWSLGWRNPWRFSFDRANGDMYVGDVGQGCYEEVSYQPGNSPGGENYGWRIMEGFHAFDRTNPNDCSRPTISPITLTLPITDYGRNLGSTVAGGYVYRGQDYPWLDGVYFFGDFGSGRIWAMQQISPGVWNSAEKLDTSHNISSFGEDEDGELYVVSYSNGRIYRLTSTGPPDLSPSRKTASSLTPASGKVVTYTIVVRNAGAAFGETVRMTDTIPNGLIYKPGSLSATLGNPNDASAPMLTWNGMLSNTPAVTVTFAVTVTAPSAQMIINVVAIHPGFSGPFTRSATIIVNGLRLYLPIVFKNS